MIDKLGREATGLTFEIFHLGVGDHVNIEMPADLHQLGGDDTHGTVVCRKCLVQLCHDAANGWRLVNQMDIVTRIGQVERGLHPGDSSSDHHYGTYFLTLF